MLWTLRCLKLRWIPMRRLMPSFSRNRILKMRHLQKRMARKAVILTRKQRRTPKNKENSPRTIPTRSVREKLIIKKNLKSIRRNRIMKRKVKHYRKTGRTFPKSCRMIRTNPMPKTQLRMRLTMRTRRPILKNRKM